MGKTYHIPTLPLPYDLETKAILKQVNSANRKLAELKGVAQTIPNENILISTLVLQEALDSSAVENIITTSDELYKEDLNLEGQVKNAAAKEVLMYREAMSVGFALARKKKLISLNDIMAIQQTNLEQYINDDTMHDVDPLVKLAIIHHQFESIHPFYDGNGRTGRILLILYLIITDLLDLPILYLSRYITHNKSDYYRLIQEIRDKNTDNSKEWESWILFMLKGIEETAAQTIELIKQLSTLMMEYKNILRPLFGHQYKHELINNLFYHPYTKIEFMQNDMMVQRKTAGKYLDMIVETGLLRKIKLGRSNYYINIRLMDLFINQGLGSDDKVESIESIHE